MENQAGERYPRQMVDILQAIWGEGFLSPGGPDEVARLIGTVDLRGLAVLDIGCGARALMAEVFGVLKPGGRFIASDWLIGHDHAPTPEMAAYIAAEGIDLSMASPIRYRDAAKLELERLRGPLGAAAARIVGQEMVDQNILIWSRMIPVLESGEHCPTHLFGSHQACQDQQLQSLHEQSHVLPRAQAKRV